MTVRANLSGPCWSTLISVSALIQPVYSFPNITGRITVRRLSTLAALLLSTSTLAYAAEPPTAALERSFDAVVDPAEMGAWLKTLSAEPNHVGSPHDKANAEMELKLFKEW